MKILLMSAVVITALDIFIIVFGFCLKFFSSQYKWKKEVKQDTLIGVSIIWLTMAACFLWVFYLYFKIFYV
jgi:hypothetical protein